MPNRTDFTGFPVALKPEHLHKEGEDLTCEVRLDSDGDLYQCHLATHALPKTHVTFIHGDAHPWSTL